MNHFAIINIAKKDLALDDDTYRAILVRATGINSLKAMSERQKIAVVEEMKRLGFKMKKKAGAPLPAATKPYIRLIHALWRSCHRNGIIQDGSRSALRSFVKARSTVDDPDFLTYAEASPIIDALKAMEARGA